MKSVPEQQPQHNRFYLYLKLWYDTFLYIYQNGWKKYRLARERYDRHQKALDDQKYKYSRTGEIKRNKEIMKKRNR